jgi:fimbrial isopeptide formation D2 family protein/LPXTG-motif cell wall-anchored protein
MYNPVFVASDYYSPDEGEDQSSKWVVVEDALSYAPKSMAKRSKITLDKTAKTQTTHGTTTDNSGDHKTVGEDTNVPVPETVNVGDDVGFEVSTIIPQFADNYTQAVFKITDAVSDGLEYNGDAKVYVITETTTTDPDSGDEVVNETEEQLTAGADTFTITATGSGDRAGKAGYVIDFKTSYLLGLSAAQKIVVKYTAKVTTDAPESVNIEDNTVTLNYSNNPQDSSGKGTLKDQTKHYTFDIDANLLGDESYKATEAVKIGVDKDGNEIKEEKTLSNGHKVGALKGAKFKLYVADTNGSTTIKDENGEDLKVKEYNNDILTSSKYIESDENGRLTINGEETSGIRGLDAGVYYLVETDAPAGYIKQQNATKFEIQATIDEDNTVTEYWDPQTEQYFAKQNQAATYIPVTYKVPLLQSYKVLVNGVETANYIMTNEKPNEGDTVVGAGGAISSDLEGTAAENAAAGKILNVQGSELPSTGGIGTTIFYILGAILVLGAGVLLVTRRRMRSSEE